MNVKRWAAGTIILGVLAGIGLRPGAQPTWAQDEETTEGTQPQTKPEGLLFHLSPGSPEMQSDGKLPKTAKTPLSSDELQRLLQRMPVIKAQAKDRQTFALRQSSKPAPRTAKTVDVAFPPHEKRPAPNTASSQQPLQVTSAAPKGDIEMAPHMSVTFNQPMLPVTTVEQLGDKDVPLKLTPQPAGKWRWLGTQTLMFVPDIRFPMASSFHVEIPAGISSATGNKLVKAESFDFETPTVILDSYSPSGGPQNLHPVMFLHFNQDIDPAAVLATVKLTGGTQPVAIRQATSTEINSDVNIRSLANSAQKKRWLAVVATQGLIPGTQYLLNVGPGTPSMEGPRKTLNAQSFSFSTYEALTLTGHSDDAQPLSSWYLSFNNPLDPKLFKPEMVTVTPDLLGMKVRASGTSLQISGRSKGRTAYKVTVSAEIADAFGQKLGHAESVNVKVGSAEPSFAGPASAFTVLDPIGAREMSCSVINYPKLKVTAYRVKPSDWPAYLKYLQEHQRNLKDQRVPGEKVLDTEIDTHAQMDELTEVKIDLSSAFRNGLGQVMLIVEPLPRPKEDYYRPIYIGWVQSTHIGLDAMADHDNLLGWASDLTSGKPLQGVEFSLSSSTGKSDANGLATLPLGSGMAQLLVARMGDDVAILPRDFSYWNNNGWTKIGHSDPMLWYVIDDRKLYRPSEKVSIKGWLRKSMYGSLKDIEASTATSVSYRLIDSRGNEVSKGETRIGRLGGFHLQLDLPKNINLGSTQLSLKANTGEATSHTFQVEEFRRPEFEVSAAASPASTVVGEHSSVTASAAYFAGGPLANAQVDWAVTSSPTTYSPPNWSEYTFGTWTPWWSYRSWWSQGSVGRDRTHRETQQTRSDSKGKSTLRLDFQSIDPPQPTFVSAQATVQDVNRQSWSTSTSLLVHPASMYVGLKSQRTFVEKGQPIELSAIVTSIEGKPVAGKTIEVKAYRLDWEDSNGEYKVKHADETSQVIVSGLQPVKVKIATAQGGTYQIDCYISDENNRRNHSQMTIWVAGGKVPPSRNVEQEAITLVPSKKEYDPADTAEVLVQAPFAPAELIVTTRRDGLAKVEHVSVPTGSTTLKFPLSEVYAPGVSVQVDALGSKTRTDADGKDLPGAPKRPAYATGTLILPVSNKNRRLTVDVIPDAKALVPGAETGVTLKLKDSAGKPVSGEVSLMMVDEAVLAMTGYDPADPLPTFSFVRPGDVTDSHLRQYVLLSKIELPTPPPAPPATSVGAPQSMMAPGGISTRHASFERAKAAMMDEAAPEPQQQIRVRSNFNPLAAFAPAVATDANGQAHVHIKLPDNLTRYRLVAVAAAGTKQFGKGESSVVARQPLMVRPSAPRFLNFGDHFEMPVVVQNQTDQPMSVELACRATNASVGAGAPSANGSKKSTSAGYSVRVPANDRVEVRIPCAADSAGTARFQFAVSSGGAADAAEISLPVWTPATTEAFATYGVIDAGAITQPIEKPKNVFEQFGGLTVTTSSTALAELTDAYLYLASYPFECSEQISSRMLASAALKDVLEAFKAPGMPDKETLNASMARDLQRLKGQQNSDGGFDYWVREKPSIPYLSVHVAHTLVRVKSKGFGVDESMLGSALEYVRSIDSHIPSTYPEYCKRSIRAYALYVLNLAGKPDPARARALASNLKDLPVEAMGWLLPTLAKDPASKSIVDEINRYLDNHITQTASTAQFDTGYSDNDYLILHSNRCDDGIILESLIATRPNSPIIPKLVRGLLDHRVAGRWANTQENCWVLLGLDRYFQEYEKVTPDFVAQMWLGKDFAGEQQFRGRNKDENALQVPMGQMTSPLVINKEGKGRLYYRIGLKYAPTDLKMAPADYGFAVSRTYAPVKDNRDVSKDTEGRWHIKAGTEVKVTVTMQASSRRYHVALVDPLPAGLEALNPALLGTGDRAQPAEENNSGRRGWWWSYHWFDHENLRDERVEAFTQLLWEGVYTYSYIARATTPGNFVVPPAKAEEMYHPETFGRSGSDRVIVEEQ